MLRFVRIVLVWCAAMAGVGCLLAPTATHAQSVTTPQNEQVNKVRSAIEQAGVRVFGAGFVIGPGFFGGQPGPVWWVDTEVAKARPVYTDILEQYVTVVSAMHRVLGNEPPTAVISIGQVWLKHDMIGQVQRGDVTTLLNALAGARTEQDRLAALRPFFLKARWRIWDLERQRWADTADFINKNFGVTTIPAPPTSPSPPAGLTPAPSPAIPTVKALTLVAESATSVGPGELVLFRLGIGLASAWTNPMEITLAWRSHDFVSQQGQFMTVTPPSVDFTVSGICLRVVARRGAPPPPPGAGADIRFSVFGAVRVGTQTLMTETPVVVSAQGHPPIPVTPAPTPARTPAQSSCKVVLSTE